MVNRKRNLQKWRLDFQGITFLEEWVYPPGKDHISGQIIATSAEVTPNGGLVRESPQNPLNSGLGIIIICPDIYIYIPSFLALLSR